MYNMLKSLRILLAGAVAVALLACQREDPETRKQLAAIRQDLAELKRTCGKGGGQAAAQPRGPDPKTVYSVPIDPAMDPIMGPATAKVTIVEAADFA